MPRYRIEVVQQFFVTYFVEADSVDRAHDKLLDNEDIECGGQIPDCILEVTETKVEEPARS